MCDDKHSLVFAYDLQIFSVEINITAHVNLAYFFGPKYKIVLFIFVTYKHDFFSLLNQVCGVFRVVCMDLYQTHVDA